MGKLTALVLGLFALSLFALGSIIVIGTLARLAQRIWFALKNRRQS